VIDEELIGMEKTAAIAFLKEKGIEWRILSEDGKSFVGTGDWKPFRRTLSIENGKVTSVKTG
jgi:hypothetical protein